PGQFPKILVHETSTQASGVPGRFSSSHSVTDFTLTISHVETTDAVLTAAWSGQDTTVLLP
ncbi:Ig kappa chain V region 3374, partial [Fukomys damarensis]